ncbi:MAG TPA: hypothetical protein VNN73_03025 [Blastocatellia bacterium]|nr:hypothetical protein [Blastocatellia bacterium]
MIQRTTSILILISLPFLFIIACSKQKTENPFTYPFVEEFHIKRQPDKPYSEYRAFYLLTEDFEPRVESSADVDRIREVLQYASSLSLQYKVPWTHFVDVNTLAPAFISDDEKLKQVSLDMIGDLKIMIANGDDCQLHLHGPINRELLDLLRSEEKLRVKPSGAESLQGYRQRKSFFFHSFYAQGYRDLVTSLIYGKHFLEKSVYDGNKTVLAFRPGGWDHGSSSQDTFLYFNALSESGLIANSGLVTGEFGTQNWRVGNDPGHNIATVNIGEKSILEISPTAGPGGYINPVLTNDLEKLVDSASDEMVVIVSVFHLSALQKIDSNGEQQTNRQQSSEELQKQREALARHFQTVADLVSRKILYPITLRELIAVISEQQ